MFYQVYRPTFTPQNNERVHHVCVEAVCHKHFLSGCIEVHVTFDDPNRYNISPMTVESGGLNKLHLT